MPLKMRPTGLGHGVYKDNVDYGVFCGDWCIGRIYETRTGPADLRWFWALYAPSKPGTLRTAQPRGDAGPGQGRVRGELEAVEGVGGDGGGKLADKQRIWYAYASSSNCLEAPLLRGFSYAPPQLPGAARP